MRPRHSIARLGVNVVACWHLLRSGRRRHRHGLGHESRARDETRQLAGQRNVVYRAHYFIDQEVFSFGIAALQEVHKSVNEGRLKEDTKRQTRNNQTSG